MDINWESHRTQDGYLNLITALRDHLDAESVDDLPYSSVSYLHKVENLRRNKWKPK